MPTFQLNFKFWQSDRHRTGLQYLKLCIPVFLHSGLWLFSFCLISRNKLMSKTFFSNLLKFWNYSIPWISESLHPQKCYHSSYYSKGKRFLKTSLNGFLLQFWVLQIETATTLSQSCFRVYHQRVSKSSKTNILSIVDLICVPTNLPVVGILHTFLRKRQ